jgi:hypothetical protein
MSHKATAWAFEQDPESITHKLVLILLADWADENGLAFPRQETIAVKACSSVRTVGRALADLEAEGYLKQVKQRRRDGRQGSSLYQLNFSRPSGWRPARPTD